MVCKQNIFKGLVKALFAIFFAWFSLISLRDFINGKVVFDIINELNPNLMFPSITLCPKQQKRLIYLKVDQIQQDYPHLINSSLWESYNTFFTISSIGDPFDITKNYSFSLNETELAIFLINEDYGTVGKLVSPGDYDEEYEKFLQTIVPGKKFGHGAVPVSYHDVNTEKGRCFNLQSKEIATLDPQYQGEVLI